MAKHMQESRDQIVDIIARYTAKGGSAETPVAGLSVGRLIEPMAPTSFIYEPSLCMCISGEKNMIVGGAQFVQDEQMFLLFSADMPSIVSIDRASQSNPYTAILFRLDLDLARAVAGSVDTHLIDIPPQAEAGMAQGRVDDDLLEVILRLVRLIERQQEIPVLAGLVQRELLFRLLVSSSGNRLRHIIMQDSPSHRISRAIRWLRENYAKRTTVDELAEQVGMGVSTLHRHFQEVTTMSPLQYQKSLRLHEARRLMITDHVEAGAAAYRVGYESATQFNREYRRLFGAPPIRDTKALRQVKQSAVI